MAKTYTAVPDKTAGDVFTEAMWDTYIRDNVNNLIVPPACRVYNSANLSIGNGSFSALTFNSERYDTDSMHSTSVNTSRITMATAGIYHYGCTVYFATSGTGYRTIRVMLNGTTSLGYVELPPPSATGCGLYLAGDYAFAANDYIEFQVYQNSGGALNALAGGNYSPEAWATWRGRTS